RNTAAPRVSVHRSHYGEWNGCRSGACCGKSGCYPDGTSGENESTPHVGFAWHDNPAGSWRLMALQAARNSSCTPAHPPSHSLRRRPAERAYLVTRRPIHRLQLRSQWEVRHLGAAGERGRLHTDHQGTGAPSAAGLVAGWEIHCVSFRGRRRWDLRCPGSRRCGTRTKDCAFRLLSPLVTKRFPAVVSE